ncbi:MAG: tryptophan synthase subunit alpha [Desulfuromonadales bacterium]|nr:tryptophan synthase subunit alpha [Desulfuromonadales bacterium]
MSRIRATFAALKQRGEKGLITFLTAGDPDLATSEQVVHCLVEAGVDLIELGIPFSDPMADGPTIQAASERALAAGATLCGVLELVSRVRQHSNVPIVLMGYYNPVLQYGPDAFAAAAARAGVDGLLLVDLPPEEAAELQPALRVHGIDLITLLAPTTDAHRREQLAKSAEGFLYYVSMTGVTGSQRVDADAIAASVEELRQVSPVPVAVGFGVTTADDARQIAGFADAVVVGSALVRLIAEHAGSDRLYDEVKLFATALKKATCHGEETVHGSSCR